MAGHSLYYLPPPPSLYVLFFLILIYYFILFFILFSMDWGLAPDGLGLNKKPIEA
jgi:hypothetical protein